MNKPELIDKCTYRLGTLPRTRVEIAFDAILELMTTALIKHDRIEVRGFGSFSVRTRKPRTGRNPKSGEPVILGERKTVHFKPGKEMRAKVNNSMEVDNE